MTENASFFDTTARSVESLLTKQVNPSAPYPSGLSSATSMVLADRLVQSRMAHFPDNLYDLRDDSHLVRLMRALLGDSGVGQLLKRNVVAQFQATMSGSHFFDLDRFYGAIFGVSRTVDEVLDVEPYVDTATVNEWDQIDAADASYRDRISRLASAINLGATLPGIAAAAEAVVQCPVEIYETWRLLDTYNIDDSSPDNGGNTWDDIAALYPTWADADGLSWSLLSDGFVVGRIGTNSRSEVVVHPRKDYDDIASRFGAEAALRQQAQDSSNLVRVLSVLKPAGVLLTIDMTSLSRFRPVPVTRMHADSNMWEIVSQVTPRTDLVLPDGIDPYPLSSGQARDGVSTTETRTLPRPPWTANQTADWSYAPEIVATSSYTLDDDGAKVAGADDQTIVFRDGYRETFDSTRSIMDVRRSLASRYSAEGVMVAHPYSDARSEVVPHA